MRKLYIVRLTKQERVELQSVVKKLTGTGQKVRRAQILLQADANGPHWIDEHIAEVYACRIRTVERNLRQCGRQSNGIDQRGRVDHSPVHVDKKGRLLRP